MRSPQFAANGVTRALLAVSGVSWLYPTKRNAMERVRQLTPRTWGSTLAACIAPINAWLRGWHGFFGIASASASVMQIMRGLDGHIRRRLRAILLRHWKRRRTIVRNLIALGVKRRSAWKGICGVSI